MARIRIRALGASAVLCLSLAGCAGATEAAAPQAPAAGSAEAVQAFGGQQNYDRLQDLYRQAVDRGQTQVVVYGPEPTTQAALDPLFKTYFPEITLVGVSQVGPGLTARLGAEAQTGQHQGDVVESGDSAMLNNSQYFAPYEPFTAPDIAEEYKGPNSVAVSLAPVSIGYNTDLVTAQDAPKGWASVLDPRYAGALGMQDPTSSGLQLGIINRLLNRGIWTPEQVRQLANLHPQVFPAANPVGAVTAVGQGQRSADVGNVVKAHLEAKAKGAPIEASFPLDRANVLIVNYAALIDGAPNPLAAQLYINWRLTNSAAQFMAQLDNYYSPLPGAPGPAGYPPLDQLDTVEPVPFPELQPSLTSTIEQLKPYFTPSA